MPVLFSLHPAYKAKASSFFQEKAFLLLICDVMPGKHAIDAVTFMSSDLEKNEIERITELDFKLHIFDEESWQDIVTTDTITLNFD